MGNEIGVLVYTNREFEGNGVADILYLIKGRFYMIKFRQIMFLTAYFSKQKTETVVIK